MRRPVEMTDEELAEEGEALQRELERLHDLSAQCHEDLVAATALGDGADAEVLSIEKRDDAAEARASEVEARMDAITAEEERRQALQVVRTLVRTGGAPDPRTAYQLARSFGFPTSTNPRHRRRVAERIMQLFERER